MNFASITLPELAPILTIFVGMLGGFYVLVKFILTQSEKTAVADREERQALTKAVGLMAEAGEKQARATIEGFTRLVKEHKDGNDKSEKRNGHLGEQNIQIAKLVTRQNIDVKGIKDSNYKIAEILIKSALIAEEDREVLLGSSQVVIEQVVENQIVNNKETK